MQKNELQPKQNLFRNQSQPVGIDASLGWRMTVWISSEKRIGVCKFAR